MIRRRRAVAKRPRPTHAQRSSSYPFVSGDTFRLTAEHVVDGPGRSDDLPEPAGVGGGDAVFLEIPFLADPDRLAATLSWCERITELGGRPPRLIVHNGDLRPDDAALAALAERSAGVWCVNAPDGIPGVTPIPIGLENVHHDANGVLGDFLAALRDPDLRTRPRERAVLASFREGTNPTAREPLARAAARSRYGFAGAQLRPEEHRAELRRTALVLSPPGNGPDCHRTWEAIALGAVPVVLRGSVAPSLVDPLPVLQLDDLEDALSLTEDEIRRIHAELSTRPVDRSLMPFWVRDLSRGAAAGPGCGG